MNVGERVRMVAITPAWMACSATWAATSAVLLTLSAVRERRPR
ncbi:hypothetical protein ACI797_15570 [Geodermatophilus sp. SYSU D00691]